MCFGFRVPTGLEGVWYCIFYEQNKQQIYLSWNHIENCFIIVKKVIVHKKYGLNPKTEPSDLKYLSKLLYK